MKDRRTYQPPGRPRFPLSKLRRNTLPVRFSDEEFGPLVQAAIAAHRPPSAWAREMLVAAARVGR